MTCLGFAWLSAGEVARAQDDANDPAQVEAASQPASQPAPTPASGRLNARKRPAATTQPATQPAAAEEGGSPLATQEGRERLEQWQQVQELARQNGGGEPPASAVAASEPAGAAASQPATTRSAQEHREELLRRSRERAERLRQQRLEAASRRAAQESTETQPAGDGVTPPEGEQPPTGPTRPRPAPRVHPGQTPQPATRAEGEESRPVQPPPTPPDGRTEWFNFSGMAWEDVVRHFAERLGKPLLTSDVVIGGELDFQTPRRYTKEEAIDELNYLLVEQGYYLHETENYVYLLPLNELSKYIEPNYIFESMEAFDSAQLRDMQFAQVFIRIEDRPAEAIRDMLAPAMPDHALPVVAGETNSIKITGLARDVRRFAALLDRFKGEKFDPRTMRIFEIKTRASDIAEMVRTLLGVEQPQRRFNRETRQWETVGGGEGGSNVRIIPDERTNTLIVKGTPAELKEVEEFISTLDKKKDIGEFKTHVIEVEHGNAREIRDLLNNIFQQERGPTAGRTAPGTRQRFVPGQARPAPGQVNPEEIIVEDIFEQAKKTIRLEADERTNSLIVYANDDGIKRVREMLEVLDKPVASNYRVFKIENAAAEDVFPTVQQIAQGLAGAGAPGRGGSRAPTVVLDSAGESLHVIAEREAMDRIEQVIQQLDVAGVEDERHVVQLRNLSPSRVAQMITPILQESPAAARRGPARGGAPVRAAPTSQVIPLDESNTLIVICQAEEWEKVEQIIRIADETAVSDRPETKFYPIANANPQAVQATVAALYRNYTYPGLARTQVLVDLVDEQLVVQAIRPAQEEIDALLKQLDVPPSEEPLVILPLEFADAQQVADIAQGLLPPEARGGRGRPGAAGILVQAEPTTNSLIIKADKLTLERVRSFAADMESKVAAQKPERRFYSLKNASPRDVIAAVTELFEAAAARGRGGRGPVGTGIKAALVGNQVVIDAPSAKQNEIATLISQLDEASDLGITSVLVKLPGTNVQAIAQRLTSAFQDRVKQQGVVARFEPDQSTETILMTVSKDAQEDANKLLDEYRTASSEILTQTQFYQLRNATANEVAPWLREELVTLMSRQVGRTAAELVKVTPDARTNRIVISAPQLAVNAAKTLLEQFDIPAQELSAVALVTTETRKLPGLDVQNLAGQLQRAYDARPPRPDKLRFVFSADRQTETLIFTAPKDSLAEVDEQVAKFSAASEVMANEQQFFDLTSADANYMAQQLRSILDVRIGGRYGRDVASRVTVIPDVRLNKVVVNGPKVALEMAAALVAELDKEPVAGSQLETISLQNADSNAVTGVINTIFREKIQARTLQVSAEMLSNSLIVGGMPDDIEEIRKWALDLDAKAIEGVAAPQIFELKNANPWEVFNVLQQTFVQRAAGRRVQQEIKFSIIGNGSIVVQAPKNKLEEIAALIAQLDQIGKNQAVVRTYELPGMGAGLNQLAQQIQSAVNARMDQREQRVTVTPVPSADAIIVTALERQLEWVETAMEQFKALNAPPSIETIKLENADANLVAAALQRVLAPRISAGRVQITPETMSNSIIVSAAPEDMKEIRDWAASFDASTTTGGNVATIELKYADPGQVANLINQMFAPRRGSSQAPSQEVRVSANNGRLVVNAPPATLEAIRAMVANVDAELPDDIVVKMYNLKVMSATMVSVQVQAFLRSMGGAAKPGQLQPGAFAEPSTNTLVVLAPKDKVAFIDGLIAQIEATQRPIGEPKAYALTNVRADQVARSVEQMLRAKVTEQEGTRAQSVQLAVAPEPTSNRLMVYAPSEYQDLARELIRMIDEDVDTGEIVHIIRLEKAAAAELVNTVNQTISGARGRTSPPNVTITADAGSNAVLISGLPKDVAEVEKLVADLETSSIAVPELQIIKLKYADALNVEEALKSVFTGGGADLVTVSSDEYYNRLLVTANKRKMRQVEAFVAQLDMAPTDEESGLPGGREIYFVDITRGDAFDIAWDVSEYFPPPEEGGPTIDSDWFGEYIKVVCRPTEFSRIEKLIQQFDRRARVEQKIKFLKPRTDPARLVALLQARQDNIVVEQGEGVIPAQTTIVEDLWPDEDETSPETPGGARNVPASQPGVHPFMAGPLMLEPLYAALGLPPKEDLTSYFPARKRDDQAADKPAASAASQPTAPPSAPPAQREPVKITVLPDGRMAIAGSESQVTDIEDAITLLEEDMEVGEVIRIFRFRHGDVNAAARIIELMFNERQPMIRISPQALQDMERGGGLMDMMGGGRERRGRGGEEQGSMADQLRNMIGGRGGATGAGRTGAAGGRQGAADGGTGQRIRIATDASHNYLIIKCEESLLPEIRQLLREMDIPPAEVSIKVFQLKNLDATETAANIKDVLGITKARTPAQRQPSGFPGSALRNMGGAMGQSALLLELFQQQMVSMAGVEGGSAKIEQVEVVPNQVTNSLLVSAPKDVMKIVENFINELEELEGRDVVVFQHRPLTTARVDDVLPLLQEIFSGAAAGRGGRTGKANPADLGPVTISGDPRNNAIIYTCEAKDVATVEAQITRLDIEGSIAEAETYVCEFGDAESIARVVGEIFIRTGGGGGGAGPGRRGGGAAAAATSTDVRISAEPATNTIVVWGPLEQRDLIFQKIEELDKLSRRDVKEIPVVYANPERLAEKLSQIFGGSVVAAEGGARGGRGARGQLASTQGRIVLVGDKNAMKLLVRAPEAVFQQMKELAELLDQPNEQLQIRSFTLKHADASVVVESVKGAMLEYITLLRQQGGESDFDAFTAVADPRTNSVMVVGSKETFAFVSQILETVDVETPAEQQKKFRIFVLDTADAATVADAINTFAAGGDISAAGGAQPGGRGPRRGALPGGGAGGLSARQLDVNAVADVTNNSVLVYGRPEDIDRVESEVIAMLDTALASHRDLATILVQNALPSQVASYVEQFLDESATTPSGRPGAAGPRPATIIPHDTAGKIVVYGSQAQIARIQSLVEEFDNKELVEDTVKIVKVPYGQDAVALAQTVERLVNDGENIRAQAARREPRLVTITADAYSNALMVYGSSSQYGLVETVVQQLSEIRVDRPVTRIIQLTNLSAQEAQSLIDDLQRRRGGSSTPPSGGLRTQPGGSSRPPSSGLRPSGGRSVTPSGGTTPRQPTSPPRRPPSTGGGRRPGSGGGSGGGGGGGAMLWPALFDPAPQETAPVSSGAPFIATLIVNPFMNSVLAMQNAAQQRPPRSQPATQRAPRARRPAATQPGQPAEVQAPPRRPPPARTTEPPPATEEPERPATGTLLAETAASAPQSNIAGMASVSGELRGDVAAMPLDSRQIIVTGDEQDVEFIMQMLELMDATTPQGQMEVFVLQHAKAPAVGPIVEQTMQAWIEQKSGGVDRGDRFSIISEGRSNSLIVTASEPNMELIREIIGKLDIDTMTGTEFRSVALNFIRATEAAGILQPLIQRLNEQRQVPSEAQAAVQAIERSNSLLIVGTPADIAEIENMISGIDVELPPEQSFTTARVVIVELRNALAENLAETMNALIEVERAAGGTGGAAGASAAKGGALVRKLLLSTAEGRELPALDLDKPIRILPEKGKNALIVFSTPSNNEALKEVIGLFDQLPAGNEIDVKSFALQHAAAATVAEMLQTMFDDSKKALQRAAELGSSSFDQGVLPPVPPSVVAKGLPYNVVVSHDARSNSVIVIGHEDAVMLAAGLIRELDRPSGELNVQPFVISLKNVPAGKLKEQLDEMLESRLEALGDDANKARDSAILSPDERSNSLIVLATPDMHKMIEGLAAQLDGSTSYRAVDSRYRRLQYADAAKLQGLLQTLFDRKQEAAEKTETQTRDVLYVLADARSNSLMLTGTRDYLREAEELVNQLDQAFDPTVEFKVRPIVLNSAANIATLLTDMIEQSRSQQTEETRGSPIHVSADPYSNNLLLAASHEDMLMLERWISVLDKPAEPGRITKIVPLRRGDAEQLAGRAQELFGGAAQGAESDVTVTHDPTTNSIVAIGPPAVVKDIEDFLVKLDSTEAIGDAVVRLFKLSQADAETAGELLRNILSGRAGSVGRTGGGGASAQEEAAKQLMLIYQKQHPETGPETLKALRSEIIVIDDVRTNSLVVTAPPESMPLVESLVAAIDIPPDEAKVRVFPLRNSDASELVDTLTTLFEESQQGGAGTTTGGGEREERVLTFGEGGAGGRQRLTFTADLRTNSIIAAGTPGYLDLVEELILELDSRPIEPRKTMVYAPRNSEAIAIQEAIADYNDREKEVLDELGAEISASRKLERNIQAVASEDTNRLILNYDARRESEVLDLVRELDQPPPQVMIQVLIVEVTMDNSLELGVEFAFQDLQFTKAGPTDTTTYDYVGGTDIGAVGTGLGGFTFTITGQDFNFLLRTLQNEGSLNVLSRPQIVAMDNQDSSIKITRDVPYPSGTATVAGQTTTTVARQDVGITLEVTPHINPDGFVRMEIRQEVSDLTGSTVDIGPGVTAPIFFKREAETVVTVRDNETVVLGGLITRREETREQKVPIVGDIPILGLAFRNDQTTTERTELLIILTPHVVRTVEDYRDLSIRERDQAKVLPPEFRTEELMQGLRVDPAELAPADQPGVLRATPPPVEPAPVTPPKTDEYGPPRPTGSNGAPAGSASYDVPLTKAAADAIAKRTQAKVPK
jgi:type II secretion system protein D